MKNGSVLPRDYDPEGFAAWLAWITPRVLAGRRVPCFEVWKKKMQAGNQK